MLLFHHLATLCEESEVANLHCTFPSLCPQIHLHHLLSAFASFISTALLSLSSVKSSGVDSCNKQEENDCVKQHQTSKTNRSLAPSSMFKKEPKLNLFVPWWEQWLWSAYSDIPWWQDVDSVPLLETSQYPSCPPASNPYQGYLTTSAKNESCLVKNFISDLFTSFKFIYLHWSKETQDR